MELDEASSRLQSFVAFYDGLKYLAEVLEVARNTNNLAKERTAAAKKADADLKKAQEEFAAYTGQTEVARKELAAKLAAEQNAYTTTSLLMDTRIREATDKLGAIEALLASKNTELNNIAEAGTNTFVQEQRRRQAEIENETNLAMAQLDKQLREKQAQLDGVTKALDKIKLLTGGL